MGYSIQDMVNRIITYPMDMPDVALDVFDVPNVALNIISGLEKNHPDLAIRFAKEVIKIHDDQSY